MIQESGQIENPIVKQEEPIVKQEISIDSGPESEYNQCDFCSKKYKQKSALNKHIKEVHTEDGKQYKCETCGKAFAYKHKLNLHIKTVHDGLTYDCDLCDKKCLSYVGLRTHKATYHPTEDTKVYYCESCSYQSSNSSNFWRHVRTKNHLAMNTMHTKY